ASRIRLLVAGFIAGVTPSCQLQVRYREKSTWWSYSTEVVAAAASSRRVVSVLTLTAFRHRLKSRPVPGPTATRPSNSGAWPTDGRRSSRGFARSRETVDAKGVGGGRAALDQRP